MMRVIATKFSRLDVLALLSDKLLPVKECRIVQTEGETFIYTDNLLIEGAFFMLGNFYWKEFPRP